MIKKLRPIAIVSFAVLVLLWFILYLLKPVIPSDIRHKASFPIFFPARSSSLEVDKTTISYDDSNHGLAYTITLHGKRIVMSEQATPDTFADGPVYAYLLQKSGEYDSVSTNIGKVSLTRPKELNGGQAAIVNPPGTLIFGRPDKDLSKEEWKEVFGSLEKIH
jgi:hypothetical protein